MGIRILRTGLGVGDVLLATGVLRAMAKRRPARVVIETRFPELFEGNHDAWRVWLDDAPVRALQRSFRGPGIWRLGAWATGMYRRRTGVFDYPFPCRGIHIMDAMATGQGVTLAAHERRPFLPLRGNELDAQQWSRGTIVVQGSTSSYWTRNKEWVEGRMQEVVDALNGSGASVVHIGTQDDRPLVGVTDLRGKTTLRESGAILAHARLLIATEGALVHLARAVSCPAVVIYTEYTSPAETGYPENSNLQVLSREPCWSRDPCAYCEESARGVSVDWVLDTVRERLRREEHVR